MHYHDDNILTYEVKMTNETAPNNDVFYTALIAATAEIGAGVARNSTNPHFKNNYADLGAVCELVKPILARHGLAIFQSPGTVADGKLTLSATILHTSGRFMEYLMEMPVGDKMTAQAIGSATTYARRYQLKAIFCLADVDDDGEAATRPGRGTDLKAAISCATTTAQLEAIRPQVEAEGSDADRAAFISKRRELKSK